MEVDPRVVEAMVHVQKAGLELIAALRNALDVAEDLLVVEPKPEPEPERVQRIRVDD
jgi:hypothetical protein